MKSISGIEQGYGVELWRGCPADAELLSQVSGEPEDGCRKLIADAVEVWFGFAAGEFVCAFGYHLISVMTGDAIIWLHAGPTVRTHSKAFLRRNRDYVRRVAEGRNLYSVVKQDFEVSRRWMRWLGFHEIGERTYEGLPVVLYRYGEAK